jgi:hypothetical protein
VVFNTGFQAGDGEVIITFTPDTTAPVTTLTSAPEALDPGLPLIVVTGTATVKNQTGASLGTLPFSCFDAQGLKIALSASDSGSGVASLSYAATGAQSIAATTVTGATVQVPITSHGRTVLTYAASDVAGNTESTHSETVIVGHGFSCATPTPGFSLPDQGALVVTGTASIRGTSVPFNQTIPFD